MADILPVKWLAVDPFKINIQPPARMKEPVDDIAAVFMIWTERNQIV